MSCLRCLLRPNSRLISPALTISKQGGGNGYSKSLVASRSFASEPGAGPERNKRSSDFNEPVKFSTSNAKSWDPINTFIPENVRGRPKSEPLFIIGSLFVFAFYFMFFREPNEIDERLSMPLEDMVPNIREVTLRNQIKQYEGMGLDTGELRRALDREIKSRQAAAAAGAAAKPK